MELFQKELEKRKFRGDIATDAETRGEYARDASLFAVQPAGVIYPRDTDDVCIAVAAANAAREGGEQVSLTARSGGSDMTGGPLTESVVVDVNRYLTDIGEISSNRVRVGAGVWYRDLDKATKEHGLILPSYPASREICTVGGMVANNSGGEKTLAYGKTEEYVDSITVVLADGTPHTFTSLTLSELAARKDEQGLTASIYKKLHALVKNKAETLDAAKPDVSKNSAGYYLWNVLDKDEKRFDPTQVIVGSQGTLGIITEITFRLIKPKPKSRIAVAFLSKTEELDAHVQKLLAHKPESMEAYDDHTFSFALRYLPELLAQIGGNIFKLAWQMLPDLWVVIKNGGLPKLVLLAEFTADTAEEAGEKAEAAAQDLAAAGVRTRVTKNEQEGKKYFTIRRESYNLLRNHVRGKRTAPFIDDVIVRPEKLPEFLPAFYAILNEYDITYTLTGHAGDGNFHVIPLMDLRKEGSKEKIREIMERVHKLVFEYGGSITAEHNDGLIRSSYLPDMYGSVVYGLFEEVKTAFDPDGLFNPGKKVRASREYAFRHIDVEPQKNKK